MNKLKNNQSGFSVTDVLLLLIFLAIVSFIGVYVAHNHTKKSVATSTKPKYSKSVLQLANAVAWENTTYATYGTDVLNGQVLQDKSAWATNNPAAAGDLQFINSNKNSFTAAFIAKANSYESSNTTPPNNGFLICTNIATLDPDSMLVKGVSENGDTANLTLNYGLGGQNNLNETSRVKIPFTAVETETNSWEISSIDLSSCGS
jgi:hypothetical protein